jgi:hypothetical protein
VNKNNKNEKPMSDSGAQPKLEGKPLGHHVRRMDAKSQLSELRASPESKP